MTILLLAEHDNASLNDQTAKALTAAATIGGDVHVLVAGSGAKGAADAAAKLSGVPRCFWLTMHPMPIIWQNRWRTHRLAGRLFTM